jgi:hypothetical protein
MSRNPIIEISYAGHIGGTIKSISSSEEITKRIRKQVSIIKGCPISRKCTTKITEKSFREMCAIFQKRAGLLGKKLLDISLMLIRIQDFKLVTGQSEKHVKLPHEFVGINH